MDELSLRQYRQKKDEQYKVSPQSPLSPAQKQNFTGLNYYPYNEALDLTIDVKPFTEKKDIQLQTSSGEIRWYLRYGEITFDGDGESVRLTVYKTPHGFFLPFVDAGAGLETYPSGRYIDPEHLSGDTFHIDLNQVYNPMCAYGDGWSCPITPAENRIKVHIKAGEKIPDKAWVK